MEEDIFIDRRRKFSMKVLKSIAISLLSATLFFLPVNSFAAEEQEKGDQPNSAMTTQLALPEANQAWEGAEEQNPPASCSEVRESEEGAEEQDPASRSEVEESEEGDETGADEENLVGSTVDGKEEKRDDEANPKTEEDKSVDKNTEDGKEKTQAESPKTGATDTEESKAKPASEDTTPALKSAAPKAEETEDPEDDYKLIDEKLDPKTGVITQTLEKQVEDSTTKISVISDIHILPKDMIAINEEFEKHKNSDRKFFEESVGLLEGAIQLIEKNGSTVLFVTGDLTKDGERLSHEKVAEILSAWVANAPEGESRRVFLVPGNHDINNHNGKDFTKIKDGKAEDAERTNPQEYVDNYADLVYNHEDVEKYNESDWYKNYLKQVNERMTGREDKYRPFAHGYTSYVGRLEDKGITVIGLDTAIYTGDVEGGRDGFQITNGTVTAAEMSWIADQAKKAQDRGDTVVLLCHHAFMPTFKGQEVVLSPYIISNWDKKFGEGDSRLAGKTPGEVLASLGIHYIFTGHLHANDIAKGQYTDQDGNTRELVQIQTGSTVTYPMPIRHLVVTRTVEDVEGTKKHNIKTDIAMTTEKIRKFTYWDHSLNKEVTIDLDDPDLDPAIQKRFSADGLITEDMAKTMAESYVGDRLVHANLGKKVPDQTGEMLLGLAKSKLNPDSNGNFTKTVSILTINGHFGRENDQAVLKIEAMGSTFNITADQLTTVVRDMADQLQTKALTDAKVKAALDKTVRQILAYPVATTEDGQKSLQDLINFAYGSYLAGDEKQPAWVKAVIAKYNQSEDPNNLINDILFSEEVKKIINENLEGALGELVYRDPISKNDYTGTNKSGQEAMEFLCYLLGLDPDNDENKKNFIIAIGSTILGKNAKETIANSTVNKMIANSLGLPAGTTVTEADILEFILTNQDLMDGLPLSQAVPELGQLGINKYSDLSKFGANILDGMSNENMDGYEYAYLEDNNTRLSSLMAAPVISKEVEPEPEPGDKPGEDPGDKPGENPGDKPGKNPDDHKPNDTQGNKTDHQDKVLVIFDPGQGAFPGMAKGEKIVEYHQIGDLVSIPAGPKYAGHQFLYWKGSKYYPGDLYKVTGQNHTFTAIWKELAGTHAHTGSIIDDANAVEVAAANTAKTTKIALGNEASSQHNPNTGDSSDFTLYVSLLFVAGVTLAVMKKKEKVQCL